MSKVCLVACVRTKLSKRVSAQELYVSDLFKKAKDYATSRFDEWFILSAKYGLLCPDQIIEPYECTLNNMPKKARQEWSDRVLSGARESHPRALRELDMTVSRHPAPIVQP
jgi:hypothetical protein